MVSMTRIDTRLRLRARSLARLTICERDHRARRRRNDSHFDSEILEFLLDQAAGHLQRLGRHSLLSPLRTVEQVHLRQLVVGQFLEQRLLPFPLHALTGKSLGRSGLDQHRREVMVLLNLLTLFQNHLLAFAGSLPTKLEILLALASFPTLRQETVDARSDQLGQAAPAEPQRQRRSGQ
jgi:hypothetical protein